MSSGYSPGPGPQQPSGHGPSAGSGGVSEATVEFIWRRLKDRVAKLIRDLAPASQTTVQSSTTITQKGEAEAGSFMMPFYAGSSFVEFSPEVGGRITSIRFGKGTFRVHVNGSLKAGPLTAGQPLSIPFQAKHRIRVTGVGIVGQTWLTLGWQ